MSRAYAYTVSAVLLAAVLSPGLRNAQDPRTDSFPLSTYPMFSYDKPRTATVTSAVAQGPDGLEVPLAPKFVGTSETMQALRTIASLDRPVGEEGDVTLGDLVPGDPGDLAADIAVALEDEALDRALSSLPDLERRVIELRFGLGGREPLSLENVRKELGVSRERLRRLERDALERLSRTRELQDRREAA